MLGWVLGLVGALALGVGSAVWLVTRAANEAGWTRNGVWETGREIGTAAADPYSRARVALFGLWALPASEVVYYIARTDATGEPLSVRCRYDIEGVDLPARWWSLTVYRDLHYIDTPARRYSRHGADLVRESDGRFHIRLDADGGGVNGLPLGRVPGAITLNLRLYQPTREWLSARQTVALPVIRRTGCEP